MSLSTIAPRAVLIIVGNGYWARAATVAEAKVKTHCKRGEWYVAYESTDPTVEFNGSCVISEPNTTTTRIGRFQSAGLRTNPERDARIS